MEAELQELRETIRQLQADNDRLQQERAAAQGPTTSLAGGATSNGASSNDSRPSTSREAHPSERIFYIPRERKCPVFRGNSGIGIGDWVEEVRSSMRARYLSPLDQAYFIYDHLEGEAKEEIRYRPRADREDPERLFDILQELYGCSKSYVTLQENFFSRKQLEGESLQEYSHALFCLMEKVSRSTPGGLGNSAVLLRDQFVEYVLDPALRRELKRLVRQNPEYTLLDVRKEAIRWVQEGQPFEVRERSHSVPTFCAAQSFQGRAGLATPSGGKVQDDMAELKEMLKKQQEQINQLSQGLLQLQNPPRRPQFTRNPPVVCRRCQQPGHFARNCNQPRAPPAPQSWVPPSVPAPARQPTEN